MAPAATPVCAACVVTFNSAETIGDLLRSLAAERIPIRVQIFDNASSDDTVSVVRDVCGGLDLDVKLHESDVNHGFPAACNELLSESREPAIAVVNPDVELTRGTLERLVALVGQDPSIGIATCRLVGREGSPQGGGARPRPRLRELITHRVRRGLGGLTRTQARDELLVVDRDVECTAGALMVFRRELIADIGYLDESVFMYLEDVDFAARVRAADLRIHYAGTLWVWHVGGGSTPRPHEPRIYKLFPQVWITYMCRYGSPAERFAVRPFVFGIAGGSAIARLLVGKSPAGQVAAMWEALTYRPNQRPVWHVTATPAERQTARAQVTGT
jgi:N-acetylglucosaminyl-diphospho-decaprenol L-rhamnosyltransferase